MFRDRIGPPTALVCAGGVAANQAIRKVLHRVAFEVGTTLVAPPPALCTDNGAMIAWAGAERLALGLTDHAGYRAARALAAHRGDKGRGERSRRHDRSINRRARRGVLRRAPAFDLRQHRFQPLQPVGFAAAACPSAAD